MKRRRRNIVATVFLVVFVTLGALGIIFSFHAVAAEPVPVVPVSAKPLPLKPVPAKPIPLKPVPTQPVLLWDNDLFRA